VEVWNWVFLAVSVRNLDRWADRVPAHAPPRQANFDAQAKEMVMLTSPEVLRRQSYEVCSGCGWNVVVMERHSECASPECVLLGKQQGASKQDGR
jgi:predicted RNA-binding Zn-ribbon protein involved in translation (DUF1610 family)